MRKIKRHIKNITLVVPHNEYDLLSLIEDICRNVHDKKYVYFYNVQSTLPIKYSSNIYDVIEELCLRYYVTNGAIYAPRYSVKSVDKKYVRYMYGMKYYTYIHIKSRIRDFIMNIRYICIPTKHNIVYYIDAVTKVICVSTKFDALVEILNIWHNQNRNHKIYSEELYVSLRKHQSPDIDITNLISV